MPDINYEYSVPMTFGVSGTGTFQIPSPWNTPCEVLIHSVSAGAAGGVALSPDAFPMVTATPGAPNAGGARGMYFYPTAAALLQPAAVFFPMPLRGLFGAWATAASDVVTVVCIFRRTLDMAAALPIPFHVNEFDMEQWHEEYARQRAGQVSTGENIP